MPYSKKSSAAARYSTGTDRAAQNSPARMTKKAAQKISSHANGTFRRTRLNRPMAGSSRNAATASAEPIMLSLPPTLPTIWIM